MILKIQRPLFGTNLWLFYNKNRSFKEQRLPTANEKEAMSGYNKIFTEYSEKNKFNHIVEYRNW